MPGTRTLLELAKQLRQERDREKKHAKQMQELRLEVRFIHFHLIYRLVLGILVVIAIEFHRWVAIRDVNGPGRTGQTRFKVIIKVTRKKIDFSKFPLKFSI